MSAVSLCKLLLLIAAWSLTTRNSSKFRCDRVTFSYGWRKFLIRPGVDFASRFSKEKWFCCTKGTSLAVVAASKEFELFGAELRIMIIVAETESTLKTIMDCSTKEAVDEYLLVSPSSARDSSSKDFPDLLVLSLLETIFAGTTAGGGTSMSDETLAVVDESIETTLGTSARLKRSEIVESVEARGGETMETSTSIAFSCSDKSLVGEATDDIEGGLRFFTILTEFLLERDPRLDLDLIPTLTDPLPVTLDRVGERGLISAPEAAIVVVVMFPPPPNSTEY
mmetsp:Transcript_10910/g.16333  ORF Transcript_10910/g.16333 Transcript_10910/m.16333 type:complete len:281 (+) Transcript_10910:575-1417(+)